MLELSLAIDGPAASGKSVVGRGLAERLGIGFVDTGLIYRTCTLAVIREKIDPLDEQKIFELVEKINMDMRWELLSSPEMFIDNENVTSELRTSIVETNVSYISRIEKVRTNLVARQRDIAQREPVIMAGRDIGTRVLREARTKFFLNASTETRANRRLQETISSGENTSYEEIFVSTQRRDHLDDSGHRAVRPEQASSDAIIVETDNLDVEAVIDLCVSIYRKTNQN
ncbi:MAG: cytidylate kinase [Chloroflexi bacterium]|nr:cytidylate kinase [Chloroflexota bacterium]|tara:strand:+ start:3665 stop:4348 length:684 start_codon:yes stop_codon:yes gene_type:complete